MHSTCYALSIVDKEIDLLDLPDAATINDNISIADYASDFENTRLSEEADILQEIINKFCPNSCNVLLKEQGVYLEIDAIKLRKGCISTLRDTLTYLVNLADDEHFLNESERKLKHSLFSRADPYIYLIEEKCEFFCGFWDFVKNTRYYVAKTPEKLVLKMIAYADYHF